MDIEDWQHLCETHPKNSKCVLCRCVLPPPPPLPPLGMAHLLQGRGGVGVGWVETVCVCVTRAPFDEGSLRSPP